MLPTFFDSDKTKQFERTRKAINANQGDRPNSATLNVYTHDGSEVWIFVYERERNGLPFIYGYFANRQPSYKPKEVKKYWLEENGEGVKAFEGFWKSFPTD
jgi:hypothetical protein